MKFRKKPVVIEAFRWSHDPIPEWLGSDPYEDGVPLKIATLEGVMTAQPGDWIIRGVKGEIYPCKPDIFEATYEAVE